MAGQHKAQLQKLASMCDSPEEQSAYAATLLNARLGAQVVRAAVDSLARHPRSEARADLLRLYAHYGERSGVRDPGTYTRSAILGALRPVMTGRDIQLLVDAVCTYEFLPPEFTDEAALLRATALVMLNELDEHLACYFATRLLADQYTERMSGEPALTAVRVLASQSELLPLYYYAARGPGSGHPEVKAECLRRLSGAPGAVIDQLVAQYGDSDDTSALVGLFDLLLQPGSEPRHLDFLSAFLGKTLEMDLYRYLVTLMVVSMNSDVHRALAESVRFEDHADKVDVVLDALLLAPNSSELASLCEIRRCRARRKM